ncbi:MAG TPA: type II secretion system minor pseudopilin GspJ [Steroidobacteraceae bacterium]|nr:type II secretion system minor pseudopilin GspJ [Steroidobacteraceae bacterium]
MRVRNAWPAAAGFTLLEILVALAIAALMFAMGYGAINQAITTRAALKQKQARLIELQTAVRVLEQDFVQLTPRPVRQPIGDEPAQPALQGSAGGTQTSGFVSSLGGGSSAAASSTSGAPPLLALTRGGWANPTGLQRPAEQRVAYFFENGTLRREYWYVLDPTLSSTTAKRDLLTKVKSVTFEYMDLTHTWQPQWPPSTVAGAQALESNLRIRPMAVRVTIDTEDFGKIVRIFEVAG